MSSIQTKPDPKGFEYADHEHWINVVLTDDFLLDFLSVPAANSICHGITQLVYQRYKRGRRDSIYGIVEEFLGDHALAGVLTPAWRTRVCVAVGDLYTRMEAALPRESGPDEPRHRAGE